MFREDCPSTEVVLGKVNGSFSSWLKSIIGVLQGSVLGSLLFNIFISNLFFLVEDIETCNYADDTTFYVHVHELENIVSKFESDADQLSVWFQDNNMKLNADKCHLLIFGEKSTDVSVEIGLTSITESTEEKFLGLTLDKKFYFKNHINIFYKKAGQKLHAIQGISNYVNTEKLRTIMDALIVSQVSYFPVFSMFYDRSANENLIETAILP